MKLTFRMKILAALIAIISSLLVSCDFPQYKQIGDTNFLIWEGDTGTGAYLCYSENPGSFISFNNEGIICDVFWNDQYVIAKSSESGREPITYWYILKNIDYYRYKDFEVREYLTQKDYTSALDSLGLVEKNMRHTDGSIPWRLF